MPDDPADNLYIRHLEAEDEALFREISGELDLAGEIRLVRTLIINLCKNLPVNHPHVIRALGILCRMIAIQARRSGAQDDLLQELEDAGERTLAVLEGRADQTGSARA